MITEFEPKSEKGSALKTLFIHSEAAKEAYKEWHQQGPAPTNGDILEFHYDRGDFELFEHLANYMFNAGRKYEVSQKG